MAETPNTNDQAERLRRLQERRAASGRSNRTPTDGAGSSPAAPQSKRARRRHPAAATRVVLAGLSVTSFFAVGGAIAVANRPAQVAQTAAAATPITKTIGTPSTAGTAAQPAAATNAVVHTTTGGSAVVVP
jgi:hypothetical protein